LEKFSGGGGEFSGYLLLELFEKSQAHNYNPFKYRLQSRSICKMKMVAFVARIW